MSCGLATCLHLQVPAKVIVRIPRAFQSVGQPWGPVGGGCSRCSCCSCCPWWSLRCGLAELHQVGVQEGVHVQTVMQSFFDPVHRRQQDLGWEGRQELRGGAMGRKLTVVFFENMPGPGGLVQKGAQGDPRHAAKPSDHCRAPADPWRTCGACRP